MKKLLLIVFASALFSFSFSQKKSFTVGAGKGIEESLPDSLTFIFPRFERGTVYFRNGSFGNANLNYNLLKEEMLFIDPKGDTLAIDNEPTINYIAIDNDSFYYDKGYLELVEAYPTGKLAKRESINVSDELKVGGYGQTSSVSAITSLSSIYRGAEYTPLNARGELLLLKHTRYYIGDKFNNFLPVTKRNLIRMFGGNETLLEDYLKENKLLFNNEDDLKKIISFLSADNTK